VIASGFFANVNVTRDTFGGTKTEMMWLWIGVSIAVVAGFLYPFGSRLQATGLWVGKMLVPPHAAAAYPRGLQDAVTDGWPSWIGPGISALPFIAAGFALIYSWWAAILAFLLSSLVGAIVSRIPVAPKTLDWYLARLFEHAERRAADYSARHDESRAAAAAKLAAQLKDVLALYLGSGVCAPTMKQASSAPHGEPSHLLCI